MKKMLTLALVAAMSVCAMAQRHEIGAVIGGLNGLSYKYWLSDNVAAQADLAVGLTAAPMGMQTGGAYTHAGTSSMYDFTLNPNLLYHYPMTTRIYLYTGGGVNLGMMSGIKNTNPNNILGKFGVNGTFGCAFNVTSAPVVLAFDFRPGYGLGFTGSSTAFFHFFDWKLGFAVRYQL